MLEELDLSWNHLRQQGAIGIARGIEVILIDTLDKFWYLYNITLYA